MKRPRVLDLRGIRLEFERRTLIMGILNVTPDSFSDGGKYVKVEEAVRHARQMVEEGADIIDIGGESTRPGHQRISEDEELRRVIPAVEAVAAALPGVPISVDTYKAGVARRALEAGAHMINDIWGCKEDPKMAETAAEFGCPIVLMHNRRETRYDRLITDIIGDLLESVRIARAAGVDDHNIVLDPGIGFAKTREHQYAVMRHLDRICALGYPVLLGTSRKSFIRSTLGVTTDDALEGTAATVALGIRAGCSIMRVHDVKAMKRVAAMCDAIMYHEDEE